MSDLHILLFIIFSIMAVDLASKVAGRERIMPILSLFKTHFFSKFLNNPKKSVTHTHTHTHYHQESNPTHPRLDYQHFRHFLLSNFPLGKHAVDGKNQICKDTTFFELRIESEKLKIFGGGAINRTLTRTLTEDFGFCVNLLIFKILCNWTSWESYSIFRKFIYNNILFNLNHFKTMVVYQKFITAVIGDNRLHKDAAQTMGRIPCKNTKTEVPNSKRNLKILVVIGFVGFIFFCSDKRGCVRRSTMLFYTLKNLYLLYRNCWI